MIKRIVLLCYLTLLLLLYLSPSFLTNNQAQSLMKNVPHHDKLCHFVLFFLLSYLCFIQRPLQKTHYPIACFIILILFSIGLELTHLLIHYRQFEWADVLANTSGVLVYTAASLLYKRIKTNNPEQRIRHLNQHKRKKIK